MKKNIIGRVEAEEWGELSAEASSLVGAALGTMTIANPGRPGHRKAPARPAAVLASGARHRVL